MTAPTPAVEPEDWTDEEWLRLMRCHPETTAAEAGRLVAEWRGAEETR